MHNVNGANRLFKFVGAGTYVKLVTLNSGRLKLRAEMCIPEIQGNLNEQANKQDENQQDLCGGLLHIKWKNDINEINGWLVTFISKLSPMAS